MKKQEMRDLEKMEGNTNSEQVIFDMMARRYAAMGSPAISYGKIGSKEDIDAKKEDIHEKQKRLTYEGPFDHFTNTVHEFEQYVVPEVAKKADFYSKISDNDSIAVSFLAETYSGLRRAAKDGNIDGVYKANDVIRKTIDFVVPDSNVGRKVWNDMVGNINQDIESVITDGIKKSISDSYTRTKDYMPK